MHTCVSTLCTVHVYSSHALHTHMHIYPLCIMCFHACVYIYSLLALCMYAYVWAHCVLCTHICMHSLIHCVYYTCMHVCGCVPIGCAVHTCMFIACTEHVCIHIGVCLVYWGVHNLHSACGFVCVLPPLYFNGSTTETGKADTVSQP